MVKPHECAATKVCSACLQRKKLDRFSVGRSKCKACRTKQELDRYYNQPGFKQKKLAKNAVEYVQNREEILKQRKQHYEANRNKVLKRVAKYQADPAKYAEKLAYNAKRYAEKREEIRLQQALYAACNPEKFAAKDAKRRAALIRALPDWADRKAIDAVYKACADVTKATGIKHCVDHIVPLQGRRVCGLHVAYNLQILTAQENARKSNKHTG
jgi:hypothetical protein